MHGAHNTRILFCLSSLVPCSSSANRIACPKKPNPTSAAVPVRVELIIVAASQGKKRETDGWKATRELSPRRWISWCRAFCRLKPGTGGFARLRLRLLARQGTCPIRAHVTAQRPGMRIVRVTRSISIRTHGTYSTPISDGYVRRLGIVCLKVLDPDRSS